MKYVYAPSIVDSDGLNIPAKDAGGELVSAMEDLVGGINTLKFDSNEPRYVLSCPNEQSIEPGWIERTAEEVNTDYPGLVGG